MAHHQHLSGAPFFPPSLPSNSSSSIRLTRTESERSQGDESQFDQQFANSDQTETTTETLQEPQQQQPIFSGEVTCFEQVNNFKYFNNNTFEPLPQIFIEDCDNNENNHYYEGLTMVVSNESSSKDMMTKSSSSSSGWLGKSWQSERWYQARIVDSYIWYFFDRRLVAQQKQNEMNDFNNSNNKKRFQSNHNNNRSNSFLCNKSHTNQHQHDNSHSATWNRRIRQLDQFVAQQSIKASNKSSNGKQTGFICPPPLPMNELAVQLRLPWQSWSGWHLHLPVIFILLMVLRSLLVISLHVFIPNITDRISHEEFYLYFGSPFHLLHSVTVFSEVMAMGWGLNLFVQHYLVMYGRRTSEQFIRVNTVVNLVVFYEESSLVYRRMPAVAQDPLLLVMRSVKLERARRLAKRFMVSLYVFNFIMAGNVTFTTLAIAYFDFGLSDPIRCAHALLVWTPIWTMYTFYCAIYAYYVFFYFLTFTCLVRSALKELCSHLVARLQTENRRRTMIRSFALSIWRTRSLGQLMSFHNEVILLLRFYRRLWARYTTALLLIFNGLVCFNTYLYFFTDSEFYIKTVYNLTSVTAFNIFFFSNLFAAKIVIAHVALQKPLFSLLVRHPKSPREKFTELKVLDSIATGETVGIEFVNSVLITMITLNSVISFLFLSFVLFIRLCQSASASQS